MDEMNMILDKHLSRIAGMTSLIEEQLEATRILIDKGISKTLSKRERIAAMMLAGMQANPQYKFNTETMDGDVSYAVEYADALLAKLEQTKG